MRNLKYDLRLAILAFFLTLGNFFDLHLIKVWLPSIRSKFDQYLSFFWINIWCAFFWLTIFLSVCNHYLVIILLITMLLYLTSFWSVFDQYVVCSTVAFILNPSPFLAEFWFEIGPPPCIPFFEASNSHFVSFIKIQTLQTNFSKKIWHARSLLFCSNFLGETNKAL